jgi:hypothetical protein
MQELGKACEGPGRVYLAGGASAVLLGWREATIDVDLKFAPEPQGVFARIPDLKNSLQVNIELAAPDDFVPALPGWEARSPWITSVNGVEFHHFDFYTQALSKIERDHAKDRLDVESMVDGGLVELNRLLAHFEEVPLVQWGRYPAIERADVEAAIQSLIAFHE